MRDVGNGDDHMPAALAMRFSKDGIVKIARVFTIDRDQRNITQGPMRSSSVTGSAASASLDGSLVKLIGNFVRSDGNQTDRAWRKHIAQHLDQFAFAEAASA